MTLEILEEKDEKTNCFVYSEAEKKRIREIIEYQKSFYWSSSSSSSLASSSAASASSSNRSGSLLNLMRSGNTSLRRLFKMEHTSLATYFQDYCCSPITKTIPLWGSETEDEMDDPWAELRRIRTFDGLRNDGISNFASGGSSKDPEFGIHDKTEKIGRPKLSRKRSFRKLPGVCLWRGRRFRFRFRLKRLRIIFCYKKCRI